MSSMGGEVGEMQYLLSKMLETRKELNARKDEKKMSHTVRKNRKETFGCSLRARSLFHKNNDDI